MNVMERARKEKTEPFSDEMILYYFQTYLQQMVERSGKTKFFMCSDEPSMMLWAKAAQVADPINPRGQGEIVRLIEYGSLQNHIGSAHLRSMVQRPEDYHSRHGLVEACVRAFLTVYYDATHPMRGHLVIGTLMLSRCWSENLSLSLSLDVHTHTYTNTRSSRFARPTRHTHTQVHMTEITLEVLYFMWIEMTDILVETNHLL